MRNYRATLTSPYGEVMDLTTVMDLDDLGSISQEPEEDLGSLTHSDFSLTLDNSDGAFERFVQNAEPLDSFEFVLEREQAYGNWTRVFAGVLDLASSLIYDDKNKTAGVTVFSFSKVLERASAVEILRTVATKTATITSGTSTLTLVDGTYSDVQVGDQVEIDDGDDNRQTFTVDVVGSSTLTTTENSTGNYTAATLTIVTPFYRDKSPAYLLDLIATQSGLDFSDSSGEAMASYPVATPMPLDGLNVNGIPFCCTPLAGYLSVVFKGSYARKKTNDVAAAWVSWAGSSDPLSDWTPYMDAEPGTVQTITAGTGDLGQAVYDHAGNSYHITYTQSVAPDTTTLRVYKNGVAYFTLDSFLAIPTTPYRWMRFDRSAAFDLLWYSFQRTDLTDTEFGYVVLSGPSKTIIDTTTVGSPRYCHQKNALLVLHEDGDTVDVYSTVTLTKSSSFTLPAGIGMADFFTVRALGPTVTAEHAVWICRGPTGLGTYVAIIDANTWQYLTSYKISDLNCMLSHWDQHNQPDVGGGRSHITRYATASENIVCGYAGGEWFVLANSYAGIIRYADFDDMSCAKAVREIAILLNSFVDVDLYRTLSVVSRVTIGSGPVVAALSVPVDQVRRPVSEIYRASVQVSGTDLDGNGIEVVIGDVGDSASRLEIDSTLATTEAVLSAVGAAALAFVASVRSQIEATFIDDGTLLRVFDRVTLSGRDYVIYKLESALVDESHSLVLLEILP